MLHKILPVFKALLNSYSLLFFSNNKLFALLLVMVSFFNPYAGLAGVIAALIAIIISWFTGLNKVSTEEGIYSYNALIIGMGMGSIYNFSMALVTWGQQALELIKHRDAKKTLTSIFHLW